MTATSSSIRNQLQDLGVDVQIDLVDAAASTNAGSRGLRLVIQGSVVDADPDDNAFNFFYPDGPWNTGKWNNEEAGQLLDAERSTSDQDERPRPSRT